MAIAVLLVGSTPAGAHPHDAMAPEQVKRIQEQVLAFRDEMKRAIEARNRDKLRQMYVDSFTHTHGSGKLEGKDSRIAAALSGDPVIEAAPAEELNVRAFGDHTAILTGTSPILNKEEGRIYTFRWMAVYVRIGGHWHLAASQATRLPVLTN